MSSYEKQPPFARDASVPPVRDDLRPLEGEGARLSDALRERLEWAYDCPLDGVRVHAGARADDLCRRVGAFAFAWQQHVVLSRRAATLGHRARGRVLAHEVAHVAQKRLGRRAPGLIGSPSDVEHEAHLAALAACAGQRHPIRVGTAAQTVDRWGPAGHYYTTYFVSRALNISDERAGAIAFYTQMVDQVSEFDAMATGLAVTEELKRIATDKAVGIALAHPGLALIGAGAAATGTVAGAVNYGAYLALKSVRPDTARTVERGVLRQAESMAQSVLGSDWARKLALVEEMLNIHIGLHALTGAPSENETTFRGGLLEKYAIKSNSGNLLIGLAVHGYGDSYAHRRLDDDGKMYNPGSGHAVEGSRGHDPDNIALPARRKNYEDYVRGLHRLLSPLGGTALRSADQVMVLLEEVLREQSEQGQCVVLSDLTSRLPGGGSPDGAWLSESAWTAVPFKDFRQPLAPDGIDKRVKRIALDWRMLRQTAGNTPGKGSGSDTGPARAATAASPPPNNKR